MTANQRRPGFRLPWSSETDEPGTEPESAAPASDAFAPTSPASSAESSPAAEAGDTPPDAAAAGSGQATPAAQPPSAAPATPNAEKPPAKTEPAPAAQSAAETATPESAPTPAQADTGPAAKGAAPSEGDGGDDFMRDLVSAMRRVADEARQASVTDLRARADEQVRLLETDAERRREDLRARAEADVDAAGEWAKAEAERIKREAEQRVVARRAQLEQQLAGDTQRTEAETKALRARVAQHERELDAYHGQLSEISDPAAFAAAAKRMPKAPELAPGATATQGTAAPTAPVDAAPAGGQDAAVEPSTSGTNGVPAPSEPVHPAEEEVLAARLAQLDATLPAGATEPVAPVATEAATTEVVVKGLGSFGAITGFRQALSGVDGIDGVALSLGQTGEFVFRATHAAGFDVRGAIAALEGEGAKIEDRPEGGLRVTLDRAR
jgi:hypothetical protein